MTELPIIEDLRELLRVQPPMLDLRSPSEFMQAHIPGAINIPLLDDEQRKAVGTCYKQQGEEAALALGDQLISGEVKADRLKQWGEWAQHNPDGVLFCWRGGLRSRLTQGALAELGFSIPRAVGGYQKLRRELLAEIEQITPSIGFGIVGGRTGTGKTEVLHSLHHQIDLEGCANHKGSAFGLGAKPQPTQVNFENRIGLKLLQRDTSKLYWFEDESLLIGRCSLPKSLHAAMRTYPAVELKASVEDRVGRLIKDYVIDRLVEYRDVYGEAYWDAYESSVFSQFDRIKKRLGGLRHSELRSKIEDALKLHRNNGDIDAHRDWISYLLTDYYDPMYDYQQEKKGREIIFRGEFAEVVDFCNHYSKQV